MRRNRKRTPDDIFGMRDLSDMLDSWMEIIVSMPAFEENKKAIVARPKHQGTMSYEEREKDIVFTIDMPGVDKKDIDIKIEDHSITVKAENGGGAGLPSRSELAGRKYNYTRKFRPTVDIDSAVATFKNGVLDITLTKIEEASKGKSVKIK